VLALALLAAVATAAATAEGPELTESDSVDIFGKALVATWVRPAYPPDLVKAQREGIVVIRFVVDARGRVTRARVLRAFAPSAAQPALDAVEQWQFRAALFAGKPVASCMDVRVFFRLKNLKEKRAPLIPPPAETPESSPRKEPEALDRADPSYAPELAARFAGARISVEMKIDDRGRVVAAKVLDAPDPALIPGALAAVRSWAFAPARQGDLAVACFHQSVIFLESAGSAVPLPPPDKPNIPDVAPR
jgi:TonB family protein